MTDPNLREILGPVGTSALAEAQRTILAVHPEARRLALTWAAWTPREWQFTFLQGDPARRFSVHVPHDGSGVAVRVREASDRPGAGPLGD